MIDPRTDNRLCCRCDRCLRSPGPLDMAEGSDTTTVLAEHGWGMLCIYRWSPAQVWCPTCIAAGWAERIPRRRRSKSR